MASSNNSIITGKLTGSIGKELVFRVWQGKTIVAKAPKKRSGEPSAPGRNTGKILHGHPLWKSHPV